MAVTPCVFRPIVQIEVPGHGDGTPHWGGLRVPGCPAQSQIDLKVGMANVH